MSGSVRNLMPPVLPTRAALLAARPGDLRDWCLPVTCACREVLKHVGMPPLADELGNARVLEAVLVRLRCGRCSRTPVRIKARRRIRFSARVTMVVLLEGREAAGRSMGWIAVRPGRGLPRDQEAPAIAGEGF